MVGVPFFLHLTFETQISHYLTHLHQLQTLDNVTTYDRRYEQ
jgi:hypothetical protein